MPVTPFHFGPGLLAKGVLPGHFSLSTFVAVEVAVDIETLVNLSAGRWPLHTWAHTLPGSVAVAAVVGATAYLLRRPWAALLKRIAPAEIVPGEWIESETSRRAFRKSTRCDNALGRDAVLAADGGELGASLYRRSRSACDLRRRRRPRTGDARSP